MKKSRFLAFTLVVAVMMMGAGYAYWTQDLTINNTVDTGILDVTFEEPANVVQENAYQPNADCSPWSDGYGMTITWTDVYPGVQNVLYFDLVNNGTLAAFVDDFTIVNYSNDTTGATDTSNPDILGEILCASVTVEGYDTSSYAGTTLEDALNYLNDLNFDKGIRLEEQGDDNGNDVREVRLVLEFNSAATEDTLPENGVFTFDIEANVYQYNAR